MKYLSKILLVVIFFASCDNNSADTNKVNQRSAPTGCGFEVPDNKNAYKDHLANGPYMNKSSAEEEWNEITIPVLFHVVYSNQEENIPTERIIKELDDLKLDFLMKNPDTSTVFADYTSRIGNPKIKFVLADTVLTEKGILRKPRTAGRYLYKSSPVIAPDRFMNVYIGNINSDGFVYNEPWTNSVSDAIFLNYKWIGGKYRLLTHETGHWLGLWHIFEGKCSLENDGIEDTPPQTGATGMNKQCDKSAQCANKGIPMYNNFMDYSDCRCMFTKGQVLWMHQIIKKFRSSFIRISK